MARAAVPPLAGAACLAALLAADHFASFHEQLGLGALTWCVLLVAAAPLPARASRAGARRRLSSRRSASSPARSSGASTTTGCTTCRCSCRPRTGSSTSPGSRSHYALRERGRLLVVVAATAATAWALLGLTVLPHRDVAGALGVPLLLLFLWRSRNRAVYAGVFLVVAALELYGTAIGTWRWERSASGPGHPGRQPTLWCRVGLRLVRRDGAPRRALAGDVDPLPALRRRPAAEQALPRSTPA